MLHLKNKYIFAFSDTHGQHHRLKVPEDVDIVICAGDAWKMICWAVSRMISSLGSGHYRPSGNYLSLVITNYLSAVSDIKQLSRSLRRPALLFFRMLWRNATELSLALSPEMQGLPMKTSLTTSTFWLHTGPLTASWTMTWGLRTF